MSGMRYLLRELSPHLRAQAELKLAIERGRRRAVERDSRPKRKPATIIPKAENLAVVRLRIQLRAERIEGFDEEVAFHPERNWRFDFAHRARRVAVEIEGLTFRGGRHQRVDGFTEDCRKYLAAMLAGWIVVRVTPRMVRSGEAINAIKKLLTDNEEGAFAGTTADGDVPGGQQEEGGRRRGSARPVEA